LPTNRAVERDVPQAARAARRTLGIMKRRRSVDEILQSTSDVLFPDALGERVVDIGSKDVDGDTPLHVMAWRADHYAVELLIEAGATIVAVGDMGQTPFHVAVMREDERLAALLLRAGADANIRSEFGDTPCELAEKQGGVMHKLFAQYAAQQAVAADRAKPRSG
jgi:ankyrin repeat protein